MTAWTKNPAAGTAEGLAVNLICADAPAFAGDGDHQTKLRLDHSVGTFHAPLADLLRAVSSGSSWHLQHKALQPLADVRELTTGTIEVGPDGRRRLPIYAQKLTPRGTYAGFRYGWCTAGNDDPLVMHENAEFVVNALTEARKFVAEGRDSAIALRGIGQDWIVLDAEDAPLFDTRSWAVREIERVELSPQFGHRMFGGIDRFEVFDKKSGERLADMLANTDGTFTRAFPALVQNDGRHHDDYRKGSLVTKARSYPREIQLPNDVWNALQAMAAKASLPVGQFVAARCLGGAK